VRVAIIPARGGSKRIPRKNLKDFLGRPIIAYPISILKESKLFDHVVVSTDDDEIASICTVLGAESPFRRPAPLSDDFASTESVVLHALEHCERIYGNIEFACCVYPTTPFLTVDLLQQGLDLLTKHGATSSFPVVKYEFPIEQAFVLEELKAMPRWPELINRPSQSLQDHYHDAGLFYWIDVEKFRQVGKLFSIDSVAITIPATACHDINTTEDWEIARLKYQARALRT